MVFCPVNLTWNTASSRALLFSIEILRQKRFPLFGLVLFVETRLVKEGDIAKRTGRVVEVPAGKEMLGRVVNPLGQPLDGKGPINSSSTLPIERKALGVMARSPVNQPLQTGIKAIDSMISKKMED